MSNDIWERAFRRSMGRGDDPAYALFVADEAVKRSWPTLHWHLPAAPAYVAACGRYVSKDRITDESQNVTCGRCKRSVLFPKGELNEVSVL